MKYFVGLDIGTSSCRAVAFDGEFRVLGSVSREYSIHIPHPSWAEQDPDQILESVVEVLHGLMALPVFSGELPQAVGISAVMHSLIGLSKEGDPITNAIIWADLRARDQAQRLGDGGKAAELYRRTGCPVHPTYLPAKLLWLQEKAPETFAAIAKVVSIKGYLVQQLTGRTLEEYSTASTTGLLNLSRMQWDETVLESVGVSAQLLPELVSPLTVLDGFVGEYARSQGLPTGVPLVIGATDGTLSNLGSGVVSPGQVVAMVGTSGAVRAVLDEPKLDADQRTWSYYLAEDKWVSGGALNNGGNLMGWFRDHLAGTAQMEAQQRGISVYEVISQWAGSVPPGSRGLVFLPMLFGERSPGWNPDSRGVLFGLNAGHGTSDIARALMEGVMFHLYGVYEALVSVVGQPKEIRASGGFAKSSIWLQIMADLFGTPLHIPKVLEGSAFGAAFLAAAAIGHVSSLTQASDLIEIERVVEPNLAQTNVYREVYALYSSLYAKLQPEFAQIARLQASKF